MMRSTQFVLSALAAPFAAEAMRVSDAPSGAISNPGLSPVQKVVTLISEMKEQVEKEADEDLAAYDKYKCWCATNEKEKTAAIETADTRLGDLAAFLEAAAGKEGTLKTEIAGLEQDIAEDKDALATAAGVREKEHSAFEAAEADMKESRGLLGQAVETLSKVQLVEKGFHGMKRSDVQSAVQSLIQVREKVVARSPQFRDVMQRDLFDMLDSLQGDQPRRTAASGGAFLGETRALPWEKSEEQVGKEANPNDLSGNAAGAKSYNSRSGSILGILDEMRSQFSRDLGAAQKEELQALIEFHHLRAAKLSEISSATKQKEQKESALADLLNKVANAREDVESLTKAKAADEKFLTELTSSCTTEDERYAARAKVRSEEIRALAETLKILTEDDSRELFGKTVSFLQVDHSSSALVAAQERAADSAMKRLVRVARRHGNWALASLAVRVKLDAFTKVKEMMDKMLAELQKQQKEEYQKWETCKKDIDETEDSIKEGEETKEDLDEKHRALTNAADVLTDEIEKLNTDVADMQVSLKQAGEDRKAENAVFQTAVSDQRAAVQILNKALARLKQFYEKKAFVQQEPGAAAPPPPPTPKDYEKSASSGGVIQLLMKIISEAEAAEAELQVDEQHAQEEYATIVRDTTESIEANRAAISQKEAQKASTNSERAETEAAQLANGQELDKLNDLLKVHHQDCDFLLKFFDIRQQSRAEEMDAIGDAKAILSGANFGK